MTSRRQVTHPDKSGIMVLSCCTVLHGGGWTVPKPVKRRKSREPFGRIRRLPSGRHQAAYMGPDLGLHKAASTFETLLDARAWVTEERRRIDAVTWTAPASWNRVEQPETFGAFARAWLADRPLKPRSRELYTDLLDQKILPRFADVPLK